MTRKNKIINVVCGWDLNLESSTSKTLTTRANTIGALRYSYITKPSLCKFT